MCLCAREAYRQLICPEMDVDEGGFALLDASRQRASLDEMHDRRRGLATATRAIVQTAARLRLLRTDLAREIDDDHLERPRGSSAVLSPHAWCLVSGRKVVSPLGVARSKNA